MKYESVTIKDIAKALNCSTSTVSRALRGSYEISDETKRTILEYAEKINYRPNPVALSLKNRKTRSIAVMMTEVANNFFSVAINGIESIAYNRGYHVIITQSHESAEREKVNILHHASRGLDGLLISLSSGTVDLRFLKELNEKGFPIVFFDRISDEINTHKVTANNYLGGFQATEHLIKQGFKKIAHITSAPYLSITKERLAGYKDALKKYEMPCDNALVKNCANGGMILGEVENAVNELFNGRKHPDAIFTASDRITILCFRIVKSMPHKKKIGFIGFSNTQDGDLFCPSMSLVKQPAFEIGYTATEMLIEIIESRRPVKEFRKKVLDTQLIVRESSIKGGGI